MLKSSKFLGLNSKYLFLVEKKGGYITQGKLLIIPIIIKGHLYICTESTCLILYGCRHAAIVRGRLRGKVGVTAHPAGQLQE